LMPRGPRRDVITELFVALRPAWSVQREIDCEGGVSIIVSPLAQVSSPAFVLYEKAGVARASPVVGDD
jgi:hypothetical protein